MSLSCSSARRRVSRSKRSDLEGGRGIGGRANGDVGLRGEDGLDLDRELERVFVGGDVGLANVTGEGACICIDMAKVAEARGGQPSGSRKDKVGGRSQQYGDAKLWVQGELAESQRSVIRARDKRPRERFAQGNKGGHGRVQNMKEKAACISI